MTGNLTNQISISNVPVHKGQDELLTSEPGKIINHECPRSCSRAVEVFSTKSLERERKTRKNHTNERNEIKKYKSRSREFN